jgi:hypothetical protein
MSNVPSGTNEPVTERVGPPPAPPPDRLDTWTVLDLLATTRRWRVRDAFVAGQADGLSRSLVACLNAGRPVPRWLRVTLLEFLREALWERRRPARGEPDAAAWEDELSELLRRWREPRRGQGQLR